MTILATLSGETNRGGEVVELFWGLDEGDVDFNCCSQDPESGVWSKPQHPYKPTHEFWTFIENCNEWRSFDNLYRYVDDIPGELQVGPLYSYDKWTTYYANNDGYKVFTDPVEAEHLTSWMDPSYFIHHGITSDEVVEWASNPVVLAAIPDRPVTPYGGVVHAFPVAESRQGQQEVAEDIHVGVPDRGDWSQGFEPVPGFSGPQGGGNNTKRKSTMRKSSINRKAIRRKSNKRKATRRKVAKRRKTKRKNTRRRRR